MTKKIPCCALVAALLAGLFSGCGSTPVGEGSASPAAGEEASISLLESEEALPMVLEYHPLSAELRDFSRTEDGYLAVLSGSEILRLDEDLSERSRETYESTVEDAHRLYLYREHGNSSYAIEDSWVGQAGFVSKDGALWFETGDILSCDLAWEETGAVYVLSGQNIYFDETRLELPGKTQEGIFYAPAAVFSWNGAVYALLQEMTPSSEAADCSGNYLCRLNGEAAVTLDQSLPLSTPITEVCSDGDALYLLSGDTVYRLTDDSMVVYAELLPLGLSGGKTLRMVPSQDGSLILAQPEGLFVLREGEADEAPKETKTLRLALECDTLSLEKITDVVSGYNRLNTGYTVEIESFAGEEESTLGLALASGEQFDLICLPEADRFQSYAEKGFLEPLDGMTCLQSEALFQNILQLYRMDGTLYFFPPAFSLGYVRLPENMLENGTLTTERLFEVTEELNLYSYRYKTSILFAILSLDGISQWTDGSFLDDGFLSLLEYCNRFAAPELVESPPYEEASYPADQTLIFSSYADLLEMQRHEQLHEEFYGCGAAYVPFPFSSYGGASVGSGGLDLWGVCRGADPEGAASFLEYLTSDQFYQTASGYGLIGIPLRQSSLGLAEGDAASEKLLFLIESANHLGELPSSIYSIISEETNVYFGGGCTAEECASRIQSRCEIYKAEQS